MENFLESVKNLFDANFVSLNPLDRLSRGREIIMGRMDNGRIWMGMFPNIGARRIITLTILDSMSRLWSRLLLPRTGVQRNISMELPSLLRLSKLLTATIAAASYNSLKAFGLVSDVNNAVDGLLTMWKCSVLVANVQISDSAETNYVIEQVSNTFARSTESKIFFVFTNL